MQGFHLHLGVHKTGTTYLQRWLDKSTFQPGTRWVNEVECRETLALDMPVPDYLGQDDFLIISDENLLSHYRNNSSFSKPTERLLGLAPDSPHIFLALRNYADYFASRWVQTVRRNAYRPFQGNSKLGRRWPDLLRDLARIFPNSPITVWDYADFRGNEAAIAQLICAGRVADFAPPPPPTINQRLSVSAIQALSQMGDAPRGDAFHAFFAAHPISETNPRFDPWTPETRAPFDDAYAADWDEIAKLATIWRPA